MWREFCHRPSSTDAREVLQISDFARESIAKAVVHIANCPVKMKSSILALASFLPNLAAGFTVVPHHASSVRRR